MIRLAKRENVYCKISGMATEADWNNWSTDDLKPYFDVVLSAFGPKRLMFGSDWPVLTLAGGYKRWVAAFRSLIGELSVHEQSSICQETATAAYRLQRTVKNLTQDELRTSAQVQRKGGIRTSTESGS
jgi:L-fuconolactonase